MRIALVGSSGYISAFIKERLGKEHEIVKIDKMGDIDYYLDLEKADDFDYEVLNGVDQVIFPAAISSPDLCEKEFELCWNINVTGTCKFIDNALNKNIRVLFFSSDAVFGDYPDKEFDEGSETNASTAYGKMKKAVEDRFKRNILFKAIRLSYVVSEKDKFTKYALGCRERGEVCEVYDPFYRNCITVTDVLDCIEWLISHWKEYAPVFLNIAGSDLVSREDIVKAINQLSDRKIEYRIVYPGDVFYACRPKKTVMRSRYLFTYGILKDESFFDKIKKELG
jgi:dTDP-4-dehydrorhamnose reductase